MKSELVSIDHITVLDFVERPLSKIADDRDRRSIEQGGIQQPLVLIADGDRLLLAKGLRRLRIARSLGMGKVPVVIYAPPAGYTAEDYVRELRLVLDVHRQDLRPSQKCALVEELKNRFGMMNKEVSAYLGIDTDTVTNWLALRSFIKPVVEALDSDAMTMQAARVFVGMSEKGQQEVWRRHGKELVRHGNKSGDKLHRELRKKYPPESFPAFYRDPELVAARLKRRQGKRNVRSRSPLTANEKRRLSASLEMREIELREGQKELTQLKAEINAAIAPIGAILRDENLLGLVPEEMREELERFAEVYV